MRAFYLTVDGMLSGTGIRDSVLGGYIDPDILGLSAKLVIDISGWVKLYAEAHFNQFADRKVCFDLDKFGVEICQRILEEVPSSKVEYYSAADMIKINFLKNTSAGQETS